MEITKLEVQKKNSSRVNLYVDSSFVFGIGQNTIANFQIYKGKSITQEQLDEIFEYELVNRLTDKAITYITGALKSKYQVEQYLKKIIYKKSGEWFKSDLLQQVYSKVDGIISKLEEIGYLNDLLYAQTFVELRFQNKSRSKLGLKTDLIAKGIDKEIISQVLLGSSDEDMIVLAYKKRFKDETFTLDDTKKVGYLARKGFTYDDISKLVQRLKENE